VSPAGPGGRRPDLGAILAALASGLVILLVAYPLVWLFGGPSIEAGRPEFGYFLTVLAEPRYARTLLNSLIAGLGTMLVSVLAGVPLAFFVSRTDLPWAGLVRNLTVASYITPSFLLAFAYVILLGPNAGLINRALVAALHLAEAPFDIYTMGGLIFVASLEGVPLVFLAVTAALGSMDGSLENSARILGAGGWRVAATISLPLIRPAIGAGALLAFISTLSLYGAPAILGVRVVPTEIRGLLGYPPQFDLAAGLSIYLMGLSLVGLFAYRWLLRGQRSYATLTGKWTPAEPVALGPWKAPALAFCLGYLGLAIGLPYLVLGFASVTKAVGVGPAAGNLAWDNYRYVFSDPMSRRSIANSLLLALGAAGLGTLLGLVVACVEVRGERVRGRAFFEYTALLPFGVPSIVLAIGLVLAFIRPPLPLYGTMWILLIAYLVKFLPLAVRTCAASLRQLEPALEEASRIVGASRLRTFWKVTVPLARRGAVAGAFLIFIPSFRELGASILLAGPTTETVTFAMITAWGAMSLEVTCALGVITLLITVGLFALFQQAHRLSGTGL
jgi:iron(III) transport system permease protein